MATGTLNQDVWSANSTFKKDDRVIATGPAYKLDEDDSVEYVDLVAVGRIGTIRCVNKNRVNWDPTR